jgi:multidrug efflux system membrane fusion protein
MTTIRTIAEPRKNWRSAVTAIVIALALTGASAASFWVAGSEPPDPGEITGLPTSGAEHLARF